MAKDYTELLATARKRFDQSLSDEKSIREEALKDLKFVAGDQWDETVLATRLKAGRPALTFNRTHTFVQQVSNEARQNKPQIKFVPAEDGDKDTAEIYEGLARHIQYDSDAQVAYETAAEYAAGGSFGYFRFLTKYCYEGERALKDPAHAFDLDLKVVPVLDPFAVYGILIPSCFGLEPTFGFVVEELSKDEFKSQFPDADATKEWDDASRAASAWFGTETVRVAEYWVVEEEQQEIELGDKKRTVAVRKVKCYKINGAEVLEEQEWPGYCIPIIPVLGKQIIIDGDPVLFSVIRFQRDPQKLLNYYKTRIAESIAVAPISPYIGVEGQFAGHEQEWANMNSTLAPYREYKSVDVDGKPAPPPKRDTFEPPIGALSEAALQEIEDMKATAGIFDASIGAQGNENSGVAIARRQQQSNVTNLHFMDNLERAHKKGGVVMAELIPKIYDTERMVRILGEDEAPKIVKINGPTMKGQEEVTYKVGGEDAPNLDVIVTMGRAFSTKRMESFDMMAQLIQGSPELMMSIGDIFFKNSDVAGADQLSERFKKMLPPQLQDQQGGQPEIPQQVQAQIAQMQQQHEQLNAYAQQVEEENKQFKAGAQVKQMEIQSKESIEAAKMQHEEAMEKMRLETQLAIAEANAKFQNERERMKLELDLNAKLAVQEHAQTHELGMRVADVGHETAMADKSAQTQAEQADAQRSHEGEMADRAAKAKPKAE